MKRVRWAPVFLAGLLLTGCVSNVQDAPQNTGASGSGSKYRFALQDLEGRTVTLDGLLENHKAVLLNFWATWCPFCVEEIPDLMKLQSRFADKSFTVVGINSGESREDAASFAKDRGLNYPVILDTDLKVSQTYGVVGLPTTLLVRSDGKVVGVYHSVTPKLEADVEALVR